MDEPIAALHRIALAIRDRVTDAVEQASGVPLRWRIESAADDISHGEAGIGLENLCSNLYEFDVPLHVSEYEGIQAAGEVMQMPADTWTVLISQVTLDTD
jgi:hypothetical protein